jgi:hypothetical protein
VVGGIVYLRMPETKVIRFPRAAAANRLRASQDAVTRVLAL